MRSKHKLILVFPVLAVLFCVSSLPSSAQTSPVLTGARSRSVSQPGLPVRITDVLVVPNPVLNETRFSFRVTNDTNTTLKRMGVFILWLGPDKSIRGGQNTFQILDVRAHKTEQLAIPLSTFFQSTTAEDPGEFVLAISELHTPLGLWKLSLRHKEAAAKMKNGDPVPVEFAPPTSESRSRSFKRPAARASGCLSVVPAALHATPQVAASCPNDFCVECRISAVDICNGCILSYSCSLSTCTCSFTCRTNPPCQGPAALNERPDRVRALLTQLGVSRPRETPCGGATASRSTS